MYISNIEMKNNWQTEKLDEVCDVEYGTRVVNKKDGGIIYHIFDSVTHAVNDLGGGKKESGDTNDKNKI